LLGPLHREPLAGLAEGFAGAVAALISCTSAIARFTSSTSSRVNACEQPDEASVRPELRPVAEEPGVAVELHDRGAGLGRAHRTIVCVPRSASMNTRRWAPWNSTIASGTTHLGLPDVEARADRVPPPDIGDPPEGEHRPPERHAAGRRQRDEQLVQPRHVLEELRPDGLHRVGRQPDQVLRPHEPGRGERPLARARALHQLQAIRSRPPPPAPRTHARTAPSAAWARMAVTESVHGSTPRTGAQAVDSSALGPDGDPAPNASDAPERTAWTAYGLRGGSCRRSTPSSSSPPAPSSPSGPRGTRCRVPTSRVSFAEPWSRPRRCGATSKHARGRPRPWRAARRAGSAALPAGAAP